MRYEILKEGQVVNTVEADETFMREQFPQSNYREAATESPEVVPTTTVKEFLAKLTLAESSAVEFASLDMPDAGVDTRKASALVRTFLKSSAAIYKEDLNLLAEALVFLDAVSKARATELVTL